MAGNVHFGDSSQIILNFLVLRFIFIIFFNEFTFLNEGAYKRKCIYGFHNYLMIVIVYSSEECIT